MRQRHPRGQCRYSAIEGIQVYTILDEMLALYILGEGLIKWPSNRPMPDAFQTPRLWSALGRDDVVVVEVTTWGEA